jgi:CYTH domain-containing protein
MKQFIVLLLILSSCGSGAKLRRAERLINKAEQQGAQWRSDTTRTLKSFYFSGVRNDFQFTFPKQDSVAYFTTKDSIQVKLIREKVPADSAAIVDKFRAEIECPPVSAEVETETIINRDIVAPKPYWTWWKVAGVSLILLIVGLVVGRLWK